MVFKSLIIRFFRPNVDREFAELYRKYPLDVYCGYPISMDISIAQKYKILKNKKDIIESYYLRENLLATIKEILRKILDGEKKQKALFAQEEQLMIKQKKLEISFEFIIRETPLKPMKSIYYDLEEEFVGLIDKSTRRIEEIENLLSTKAIDMEIKEGQTEYIHLYLDEITWEYSILKDKITETIIRVNELAYITIKNEQRYEEALSEYVTIATCGGSSEDKEISTVSNENVSTLDDDEIQNRIEDLVDFNTIEAILYDIIDGEKRKQTLLEKENELRKAQKQLEAQLEYYDKVALRPIKPICYSEKTFRDLIDASIRRVKEIEDLLITKTIDSVIKNKKKDDLSLYIANITRECNVLTNYIAEAMIRIEELDSIISYNERDCYYKGISLENEIIGASCISSKNTDELSIIVENVSALDEYERQDTFQYALRELQSLRMSVRSWVSLHGFVPFYYLYNYYPVNKDVYVSEADWDARNLIWNFKNNPKKITRDQHLRAMHTVVNQVSDVLEQTFQENVGKLTLVCIPASTKSLNKARYEMFSDMICKRIGMTNSFAHISIQKEKTPKHIGGGDSRAIYSFDEAFFKGRYIVLFDDVVTKGGAMKEMYRKMTNLGANVICAISIGKTTYKN